MNIDPRGRHADFAASIDAFEDERAARQLLEDAVTIFQGRTANAPPDFVMQMFARTAPEDLVRYDASEIAEITAGTWRFLGERQPHIPKIQVGSTQSTPGQRLRSVSIVEILNDDMPFLVDSVMAELTEQGFDPHLVLHPRFDVERDATGRLVTIPATNPRRESLIQVHVDRIDDEDVRTALVIALDNVLTDVRRAVDDWKGMLERVTALITELKTGLPALRSDDLGESIEFLRWLMDDNFTFLGVRDYIYNEDSSAPAMIFASALGILRGREGDVFAADGGRLVLTPRALEVLQQPKTLIITKTNSRSRVHRRTAMDYVVVKHYDRDGKLTGGLQIVGLFTSTAYVRSTRSIPYLRSKVANVMARSGLDDTSHSGKALINLLETYPRDELFQIDEDTLLRFALTILQLNERPRVRVLPRRDAFERFVSVLVYAPRDRYDSAARAAIGELLATKFAGKMVSFVPFFLEGPMVRVHFIIARREDDRLGELAHPTRPELEFAITQLVKSWPDGLLEALDRTHDSVRALALFAKYHNAFSAVYREAFDPAVAVSDIAVIEKLSSDFPLGVDFQPGNRQDCEGASLNVWSYGRPIPLSERVPVLEHMGFIVVDESTYDVEAGAHDRPHVWLHAMQLARRDGPTADIGTAKLRLDSCFAAVMRGEAENDGYNALVLVAGLSWYDVALMRTLSRYLRQLRVPYSQDYMWATHVKHATIAERIVTLFAVRFDPELAISPQQRDERQIAIAGEIEAQLATVDSLDEDRIIRHFVNAVQSAVRTNFYQVPPSYFPQLAEERRAEGAAIAIKFDSRKVNGVPLPRPLFEIFVCSPRLEAVHLRFGLVARGGIRWSDRPQDFRTEVLGLVKAQQVKNAVIVPVGAKGGFVPKRLPAANRDAIQAEAVAVYKIFMSTLLDLTDNLDLKGIVPPKKVVRHDDDDPYLVVAADKGTATFSDIANAIAREHGFWLDDAFASGGSAGYDHKRMGITARGAWESVKRHFREMDIDLSRMPFSVAGVGDMSGDVFGNGMLRERTIRLIAAFDHRDIFIDPNPDPERSFDERRRLFDLPRSSWQDFDRSVLSPGGGIFPRAAKEIDLSEEARTALGLIVTKATPQEIINAILKAPVDLLWFGGIGTYVRASNETDESVGDRANDAIRAVAAELRCKVVGEGANLGLTQRARIEAALRGIRLNNDAIDNSAGVNTSDVEVNLKIALSIPLRDGRLTRSDRDILLGGMTDEVATLVLRNNYQQTLALSLVERRGLEDLGFQQRLIQTLEKRQLLDRSVEFLPTDMDIAERRRRAQPLTRPELAVLLAYAKLALHEDLLNSDVPDDPYLARELTRYFPQSISSHFPDALEAHRLRRDIIATQLANSMINRGGPPVVVRIADQTGASVDRIAAAFAAVRDSFRLTALNASIEALDNKVSGTVQLGLFAAVQNLLLDRIVWFLRNVDVRRGLAGIVDHYRTKIAAVSGRLHEYLPPRAQRVRNAAMLKMMSEGTPEPVASNVANLPALGSATDIVLIADRAGHRLAQVAATFFAAEDYFQLDRIVAAARNIKLVDYFDRLALDRGLDAMGDALRRLVADMTAAGSGAEAVAAFVQRKGNDVDRVRDAMHEMVTSGLTLSKLTVAASLLGDLARS
ncbi:MAG TPA: NAD-glutamate dehydrogenase [Xanthobacteraceae bacterium]|nr:NAD-glutamate dehydrogenase [Xanthobacteraceae bacterium]